MVRKLIISTIKYIQIMELKTLDTNILLELSSRCLGSLFCIIREFSVN